jgi:transposase
MERIAMSQKELSRVQVLSLVLEGQLALQNGAARLGVSVRQARRLLRRLEQGGAESLVHGNRGRPPANRLDQETRDRLLAFAKTTYADCNDAHLVELLAQREGLAIGRETLRALLRRHGIGPKRRRRPRQHHRRRQRSEAKGLLVLWDGSPHRWLGPEHAEITLMAAVDDADGELLAALFAPQETSLAYLQLLAQLVRNHGIPAAIYQDRHSALRRSDDSWSLEEQLAGRRRPTQVGMALEDLAIRPIFALSPQAKGRVERLFGVLQDRLLAEMRLDGIESLDAANAYLRAWLPRYNQRFRTGACPNSFRSARKLDLRKILAFRYRATVLNDNAVRLGGITIDIPPGPRKRGYAALKVDVRQHLDAAWTVYYQDKILATAQPTALHEPLRYRKRPQHRGATSETLLYLPTTPDTFPRLLGGQIASA